MGLSGPVELNLSTELVKSKVSFHLKEVSVRLGYDQCFPRSPSSHFSFSESDFVTPRGHE